MGLFGTKSKIGAINQRYLNTRAPEGYVTNADLAQGERLRRRAGESAGAFGASSEAGVRRRASSRGIFGGPAVERDIGRVRQQEGDIIESASQQAESNLYNTQMSREKFGERKLMEAYGADLSQERARQQRAFMRESMFWNTFNKALGPASDLLGIGGGGGGGDAGDISGGYSDTGSASPNWDDPAYDWTQGR